MGVQFCMPALLSNLLHCCSHSDSGGQLDVVQLISESDELRADDSVECEGTTKRSERYRTGPVTPRQRTFKDRVRLPTMRRYPIPPSCSTDDPEDRRRQELLRIHQEFVLDLHRGVHMTQLTANTEYASVHCQLMEDLCTLKMDQGSGCIVEFPLTGCYWSKFLPIAFGNLERCHGGEGRMRGRGESGADSS